MLRIEPLHEDLCVVCGPDDEMTAGIAEALALIRLSLDGPASWNGPGHRPGRPGSQPFAGGGRGRLR
ncbi:hypothetical protein ABZY44_30275 [Streptomyces sp. NPDC006544]|uniref:hypothetical protein n=1 Tax=Streptomyces sp. NPDC006544 TaxID=3154583 RepID=UPI0033B9293D